MDTHYTGCATEIYTVRSIMMHNFEFFIVNNLKHFIH